MNKKHLLIIILILPILYFAFQLGSFLKIRSDNYSHTQSVLNEYKTCPEEEIDNLQRFDAWGNPIRVSHDNEGLIKTIKITSSGADKIPGTMDDVAIIRNKVNWNNAGKSAGQASGEAAQGFWAGLKKSFSKKEK